MKLAQPAEAVVCVGDAGINALATVRSLGRRAIPVRVVAVKGSPQIASSSRYCRELIAFVKGRYPDLLKDMREKKDLKAGNITTTLNEAIKSFRDAFQASAT